MHKEYYNLDEEGTIKIISDEEGNINLRNDTSCSDLVIENRIELLDDYITDCENKIDKNNNIYSTTKKELKAIPFITILALLIGYFIGQETMMLEIFRNTLLVDLGMIMASFPMKMISLNKVIRYNATLERMIELKDECERYITEEKKIVDLDKFDHMQDQIIDLSNQLETDRSAIDLELDTVYYNTKITPKMLVRRKDNKNNKDNNNE